MSEEEIVKTLTNAMPHDILVNTNWTLYKDTKAKDIEIERLNNIIGCLKQNELYCVDYETEEDIEKGNKIYIPFNLEEFIQELDKVEENK